MHKWLDHATSQMCAWYVCVVRVVEPDVSADSRDL